MASVKPLFIRIHFPEEVGPVRKQDLHDLQCNLQKDPDLVKFSITLAGPFTPENADNGSYFCTSTFSPTSKNGQKCNPTILVETIFNVEESDLSVYYKSIRNNIRSANFFTKASTQAGGNEITVAVINYSREGSSCVTD